MPEVPVGNGGGPGPLQGIGTIVSQRRDVWVRSATQVEDVEMIGVETIPHGVYFERAVPYKSWQEIGAPALVAPIAEAIEYVLLNGMADTAYFAQDVTDNGLLVSYVEFVVSVPTAAGQFGPQQTTVQVTLQELYDGTGPQPQIAAAVKQIKQNAGLS